MALLFMFAAELNETIARGALPGTCGRLGIGRTTERSARRAVARRSFDRTYHLVLSDQ